MSHNELSFAFQPLQLEGKNGYSHQLNEILKEIFVPQTPFTPSADFTGFDLEEAQGQSIPSILSDVHAKVVAHSVNTRHVLSLAHMVPPPATISVIADLLIGAMNQCAFIWEEGPMAAILESEVVRWMTRRIGLEETATGMLTSGGTMSNCLAAYLALTRAHSQLPGNNGKYCIICSDQAHFSVEKAAALVGSRSISVHRIKTDDEGRLHAGQISDATDRLRNKGMLPFLFICTAGTTNTGALEPANEFLRVAQACGAWCHIDAAHGGMMSLTNRHPSVVSEWRNADSISWDPHKSLYVSYTAGALLLKDAATRKPLKFGSEYALNTDSMQDAGVWHMDTSRRLEALKLWMTIKHFGLNGFSNVINHSLLIAREFADIIRTMNDFVLVTEPDTNIICFRFVHAGLSDTMLDKINITVQKKLFRSGGPLISTTKVGGRSVLRAVMLNPLIKTNHLKGIIESIREEACRQVQVALTSKDKISVI